MRTIEATDQKLFQVGEEADEIRKQFQQEPGLQDLVLEGNHDGTEWAVKGKVANEDLRRRAWELFHQGRGEKHEERVWDFIQVEPDSTKETTKLIPEA